MTKGRNRRYVLVAVVALATPALVLLLAGQLRADSTSTRHAAALSVRAPGGGPSSHGASSADAASSGPTVIREVAHGESAPVRAIAPAPEGLTPRTRPERVFRPSPSTTGEPDGALQTTVPTRTAPSVLSSFEGIRNPWGFIPPDVTGDIGLTQYVQAVNSDFSVFNKSGTMLTGPTDLVDIWASLPSGLCRSTNHNSLGAGNPGDGDPVVVYDRLADRWLISQFAWNDPNQYEECIAVSKTGDATGAYWIYDFTISSTLFDDYPKVGVWPDGYYFSFNDFAGDQFAGAALVAFDRTRMLNGLSATGIQFSPTNNPSLATHGGLLPAHYDSRLAPAAGAPETFLESVDPNKLNVFSFHANFATPANSTLTSTSLTTASFDSNICDFSPCLPQKGVTDQLDQLSDRLMQRLDYRNLGGSPAQERLVVNQTVDAGTDHAAIRWYELRRSGGAWSIGQQSTFSPNAEHRWMGSMAMDGTGDIGLGYSATSSTIFPQIRYTGRTPADPANTMQAETTMKAGGGSQQNDRWGDYTTMSVDPADDCTFWYINQYYAVTDPVDWHTRIGSFRFPNCVGITTFSPKTGGPGTQVTITGVGFGASSVVKFNGVAAATTFISGTQLKANVPAGGSTGRISVSTGTNSGVSRDNFTFTAPSPPSITSFSPGTGITGSTVTILGSSFTGTTAVKFHGLASPLITVLNAGARIDAKVPNGADAGKITVTTPAGTGTSAASFVPTLSVQSFSPASGPVGTLVVITGVGFNASSTVKFNGTAAPSVTLLDATRLRAVTPVGFTTGPIRVTNTVSPVGAVISKTSFTQTP